jgi:ribosomal protein S24E|tara:strand:+ start:1640 stop:1897 length:258 start_codon:yes stop_codon:yes gene_type:complete
MNVLKEFENKLLKRNEVLVSEEYEVNPGIEKVTEEISKKFKADKEQIVVRRIISEFGKHLFKIEAFIYDSVEDKLKVEPKPKEKK